MYLLSGFSLIAMEKDDPRLFVRNLAGKAKITYWTSFGDAKTLELESHTDAPFVPRPKKELIGPLDNIRMLFIQKQPDFMRTIFEPQEIVDITKQLDKIKEEAHVKRGQDAVLEILDEEADDIALNTSWIPRKEVLARAAIAEEEVASGVTKSASGIEKAKYSQPINLQDIIDGVLGEKLQEKALEVLDANYSRAQQQGFVNLRSALVNEFLDTQFIGREAAAKVNMYFRALERYRNRNLV